MGIIGIEIPEYQASGGPKALSRPAPDKRFVPGTSYVCKSEHYRVVTDSGAECVNVYDGQGEWLGEYDYADLVVRQDMASGSQFLISEHGASSNYDAMLLDDEMKENLQKLMGGDTLEVQRLLGYTIETHPDTGIQYLLRKGEEGRGGTVLLQSAADVQKFEALAETYLNCYPNLIADMDEAYIWAELEIKGVAYRTADGIVELGYEGVFYHDNVDPERDWSIPFSGSNYQELSGWVQAGGCSGEEMQEQSVWQRKLDQKDGKTSQERFWERRQERQERSQRIEQKRRRASREAKARKEQRRQAKLEQEHKRKRRARYVRIIEESSWKRKLQTQEAVRNYYQSAVSAEVVSFIVSDRAAAQGRTQGCVRCTYASNYPNKLDTVYYVYYSPDGLRCIREGERNPRHPGQKLGIDVLQWEIPLEGVQEYERILGFLEDFPEEDNLSFAADEDFWKAFLKESREPGRVQSL